jgi:hypothetical protein
VADAENQYHKTVVLKRADNPVIAHTVAPQPNQGALQAFPNLAGVVESSNSFVEEFGYPALWFYRACRVVAELLAKAQGSKP